MKFKDLSGDVVELEEAFGEMPSVDEANGVIRNVVLLTGDKTSKNNTRYLPSALAEAVTRYDGARMYIDHPTKTELADRRGNRSVRDLGGVYRNPRLEGNRLKADLHVLESFRPMILPIAKARPKSVGLSIRDQGRVNVDKASNTTLVEGFKKGASFSIDFVTETSLNEDLFESRNENGGENEMDYKALNVETLQKERPDLLESVKAAAKAELAKDIEDAKQQGAKDAESKLLEARKLNVLNQAGFPAEMVKAVEASIMPAAISLEEATKIVESWKPMAEKLKGETKSKGRNDADPAVRGHGHSRVEESAQLPTDDEVAAAFGGARGF